MISEELESLFIESNESNSHNQKSQFRKAVIFNIEMNNKELNKVTYDTPVYFNINEVYNYIPKNGGSYYDASKKSFEHIAKEWRKYCVADVSPTLTPGECLVAGDATPIPSIVKVDKPNP